MKRLALILALALPGIGRAHAAWTTGNTALQLTLVGMSVVDWGQTNTRMRQGFEEKNPLLGKHPSRATLRWYFPASMAAHAAVAYALPRGWREAWQMIGITVEGACLSSSSITAGLNLTF